MKILLSGTYLRNVVNFCLPTLGTVLLHLRTVHLCLSAGQISSSYGPYKALEHALTGISVHNWCSYALYLVESTISDRHLEIVPK